MISISESAWRAIDIQGKKTNLKKPALRLGVRGGGCAGFSYHIEFEELSERNDDLQITGMYGCVILIDNKSSKFLNKAVLLWEKNGILSEGFKIKNDDVVAMCSCGTSFTLK